MWSARAARCEARWQKGPLKQWFLPPAPARAVLHGNGKIKVQVANTRSPCQPLFPSNYKNPLQKTQVTRHICLSWRLIWAKHKRWLLPMWGREKPSSWGSLSSCKLSTVPQLMEWEKWKNIMKRWEKKTRKTEISMIYRCTWELLN